MNETHLILTLPHGEVTATSLSIEALARHRSPGSGKHFQGRSIFVELAVGAGRPGFDFLDEGGWRDPVSDTAAALTAVGKGKRTKTALSNAAFNAVPVSAWRGVYLVKTAGDLLPLEGPRPLATYTVHECHEGMTSDQVAALLGRPVAPRLPRLYMVLCPIQFFLLSNLDPVEYAWYATHRPGKVFRQVAFAEIRTEQEAVAATSRFEDARQELAATPGKKTKTIAFEDCLNQVPFEDWVGYRGESGGLYVGDANGLSVRPFPAAIPRSWERAEG